jgi:hypothetical protein
VADSLGHSGSGGIDNWDPQPQGFLWQRLQLDAQLHGLLWQRLQLEELFSNFSMTFLRTRPIKYPNKKISRRPTNKYKGVIFMPEAILFNVRVFSPGVLF